MGCVLWVLMACVSACTPAQELQALMDLPTSSPRPPPHAEGVALTLGSRTTHGPQNLGVSPPHAHTGVGERSVVWRWGVGLGCRSERPEAVYVAAHAGRLCYKQPLSFTAFPSNAPHLSEKLRATARSSAW